jgi:hypothetical protein
MGERTADEGVELASLVELYENAGLLHGFMRQRLAEQWSRAENNWRTLSSSKANVMLSSYVFDQRQKLCGAISFVRVWDDTWLAQHFAVAPGSDRGVSGTLQERQLTAFLARSDAKRLAFFVDAENSVMNAVLRRLRRASGPASTCVSGALLRWPLARRGPGSQSDVRPLARAHEGAVAFAAANLFGERAAESLGLVTGRFMLPSSSAAFARIGLERARIGILLEPGSGGAPCALLREVTSPGVNLTGMLDAWWPLPLANLTSANARAVADVLAEAAISERSDQLLVLPPGVPMKPFLEAGFSALLRTALCVLDREDVEHYRATLRLRHDQIGSRRRQRRARSCDGAR